MFLVERLIGVSIYSYILIMICVLIAFSTLRVKGVLGLYLLLLTGMGYCYKPYITADLYRIFQAMEWYATMDFGGFFKTLVVTSSVPASRILFWLVGKTGLPHLLPVLSCLCCYGSMFYILEKTRTKFSISRTNTAVALFFIMSTSMYISVIGGIRMMLSISLIAFCFYRESVEKKHNVLHMIACVIAVFMHDMALVVLGVAIYALVLDKRKNMLSKFMVGCLTAGLAVVALFYFRSKFSDVFEKFISYLTDVDYYDIWEYMMGGIFVAFFLFMFVKFKPYYKQYLELNSLHTATMISILLALLFFIDFSIFYRFAGHVAPIFCIPILMITLESSNQIAKNRFKVISLQLTVLLVSLILLFIGGTRGSLSALKFFVLN